MTLQALIDQLQALAHEGYAQKQVVIEAEDKKRSECLGITWDCTVGVSDVCASKDDVRIFAEESI